MRAGPAHAHRDASCTGAARPDRNAGWSAWGTGWRHGSRISLLNPGVNMAEQWAATGQWEATGEGYKASFCKAIIHLFPHLCSGTGVGSSSQMNSTSADNVRSFSDRVRLDFPKLRIDQWQVDVWIEWSGLPADHHNKFIQGCMMQEQNLQTITGFDFKFKASLKSNENTVSNPRVATRSFPKLYSIGAQPKSLLLQFCLVIQICAAILHAVGHPMQGNFREFPNFWYSDMARGARRGEEAGLCTAELPAHSHEKVTNCCGKMQGQLRSLKLFLAQFF